MTKEQYADLLTQFEDTEMHSAFLKRHHRDITLQTEHLAVHHWIVAMLTIRLEPKISRAAIIYALTHDIGEHYTGDMPSPVKRSNKLVEAELELLESQHNPYYFIKDAISDGERELVHLCDILAYILFCLQEIDLGNGKYHSKLTSVLENIPEFELLDPILIEAVIEYATPNFEVDFEDDEE